MIWETILIMAELKEQLKQALTELRAEKQRKFDQTVDLIVNLQKFDVKKNPVNTFVSVPYKIKEKKIAKNYDFFIAQPSTMPKVATTFGRVLGPLGKMPSPQLGIILNTDDKTINELKEKINSSIKIRTKDASIKVPIGKQSMEDEKIIENVLAVYNSLLKNLSKGKENIKNIEIKFTMTKPKKIILK